MSGSFYNSLAAIANYSLADELNLSLTEHRALLVLHAIGGGELSAGDLAEHTNLTTGAITGVVDRLVKRDYVTRNFGTVDRRKVFVTLTDKATNLLRKYYE